MPAMWGSNMHPDHILPISIQDNRGTIFSLPACLQPYTAAIMTRPIAWREYWPGSRRTEKSWKREQLEKNSVLKDLLQANYIDLNTFVHTKRIIDIKGSFDETLQRLIDWELIIRITGWGEVKFLPEVLVDYYNQVEPNTITQTVDCLPATETIRSKYPFVSEPVVLEHDTIKYTWESIPDKKYRYYWQRLRAEIINRVNYKAFGLPVLLQIEPTNMCNLGCPLCPVSQKMLRRESRHMRLDEFKKIIDEVQDHVLLLVLWNWGEPLMNPELPQMIRYAADRGIRTVTSTNAHFLRNDRSCEGHASWGCLPAHRRNRFIMPTRIAEY